MITFISFRNSTLSSPTTPTSTSLGAFLDGTSCRDLVSKLGRKTPTKANKLMDIARKFALGQEAVEALFHKDKGDRKRKEGTPEASTQRNPKKGKKKKMQQGLSEALAAELVTATEKHNPRAPQGGLGVFDKMLKESCPYHKGPVKHTLGECDMLRCFYNKPGPSAEGGNKKALDNREDDKGDGFPDVHNCYMIFWGGHRKPLFEAVQARMREVFSVEVATPVYLDWSDHTITFDRDDHLDHIPNPGRYPLVVDPIIGNTRLMKVLMDGGNNLNTIYVDTLDLLGVRRSQIWPGVAPFHGITLGKRVHPLGQIDLPVCFRTLINFRKEILTFEVLGF
jgi:hypothetical protein